jgi:carboxyl-terminal processing protease
MNKLITFTNLVLVSFILVGCGGSSNPPSIGQGIVTPPLSCDVISQKQFIFDVMHDTYLWYDEVPNIDIADFDTINETLDALRAPLDRFSFITTVEANDNFFEEGTFEGFGFRAIINSTSDAYLIGYVFDDAPSGNAGWKRTDRITAINGIPAATIIAGDGLTAALAGLEVGDTATFTIGTIGEVAADQVLTKALVAMNTVLVSEVVQTDNQTVGYIALSSFIENTSNEFSDAVDQLTADNITELVLDLRYNGGGRVRASNDVASYIGGTNTAGFNYTKTIHNDKYLSSNSSNPFNNVTNALSLNRVYVLTTGSTCSASELVMNSLSPFVEVIQIGATTCGKPVGMYGKEFCEQIILPIEFQSVNHNDEGDYFDGLVADCAESDDLTHGFADVEENMFASAIYHMNNAQCLPSPTSKTTASTQKNFYPENWNPQTQVN